MDSAELIRLATLEDMPELLRMGKEFFNVSGYADITSFNKDDTKTLMIDLISSGTLLTDGNGAMLGFVIFPIFMNSNHLLSQELFWWVDEDKRKSGVGLNILKKAESISSDIGAKAMMMLSINELKGDKVNKMYERLGYQKREQTYMRIL